MKKAKAKECIAIWKAILRKLSNKAINEQKLQTQAKKWYINIEAIQTIPDAKDKLSTA